MTAIEDELQSCMLQKVSYPTKPTLAGAAGPDRCGVLLDGVWAELCDIVCAPQRGGRGGRGVTHTFHSLYLTAHPRTAADPASALATSHGPHQEALTLTRPIPGYAIAFTM